MTLLKKEMQAFFDTELIHRGTLIRIKRVGDTTARNGFVTEIKPRMVTVLYCNMQNGACSYIDILAADVEAHLWDIYWTDDFLTTYHEGDED